MAQGPKHGAANHLEGQTSPYLLQHLYNPVDWYPWGEEALERSRSEDKPLFVSIGYAACHWCHVMERESFEDLGIAKRLNEHFISIKIDREERPDIDAIYMNAVQIMTGQGGWPLNIFLRPDLQPFFGGTYFPPEDRQGRIGFDNLLDQLAEAWKKRRSDIDRAAGQLTQQLERVAEAAILPADEDGLDRSLYEDATRSLTGRFDNHWGGFGAAPKFPPDGAIQHLLAEGARNQDSTATNMALRTLEAMALGGLYDHVGGGFSRYSVDEKWLVPHFEKMLYNQALLVPLYCDAWRLTERPLFQRTALETLDFVRRELTHERGGFFSALDADSEGVEGKFYVWSDNGIHELLDPATAEAFCKEFDITARGNFEGFNIPNRLLALFRSRDDAANLDATDRRAALDRLLAARAQRTRPQTDDKVLSAWNGLMIRAFCQGYRAFGRPEDLDSAQRGLQFIREELLHGDRLLASFREGHAHLNAYLDDYAFVALGAIELFEVDSNPEHLFLADSLALRMLESFADRKGGFYFTSDDHERLLTRNRSLHDGALPSGLGLACEALLRLDRHLDRPGMREHAEKTFASHRSMVEPAPAAFTSLLHAARFGGDERVEVTLYGEDSAEYRELREAVDRSYLPVSILAAGPGAKVSQRFSSAASSDQAFAVVCRGTVCSAPLIDSSSLRAELDRGAQP